MTSEQSVPLRVGVKLEEFDEDEGVENWPFHELVGSLMWLSTSARPDISNAMRAVAGTVRRRELSSRRQPLASWRTVMEPVNTVLYTRGTSTSILLEAFVNADYAFKATDKRSVSGGANICGGACCICWFSRT